MYDLHRAVLTALVRGRGSPTELIDRIEEDSDGVIHLSTNHIHPLLWEMVSRGLVFQQEGLYDLTELGRDTVSPLRATGS
jgi:DNA-binding PadR family transcriptional regulator